AGFFFSLAQPFFAELYLHLRYPHLLKLFQGLFRKDVKFNTIITFYVVN
ncbi:hypothetical protein LCGC14_2691970, partial [marine sediment metagenome]